MPAVIEVSSVWKRYRIHEFKTVYGRVAQWPRLVRELLVPAPALAPDGQFWALRDVSVEAGRGEVLGLIGPNGAGKTTLLRLIGGISRPTRGDVRVRGRIGALISVGAGFHPELTGRENIYLNGAIMGMSRQEIDRKFDSIVDFAEIGQFLETPLKRYSSGMAVRLGFSVAVHLEPDILLVDEILSVGDAWFRRKSYERMKQLFRSGVTIIFVSHSLRAVEQLCERAILLDRGRIVYSGSAPKVVNHYLNEFVAQLQTSATVGEVVGNLGPLVVERLELTDDERRPVGALKFGDTASFRLYLRVLEDITSYLKCQLVLSTMDDIPVATLWSPALQEIPKGSLVLSCRVERVSLLPGTYRADLRIQTDGKAYERPLGDVRVKSCADSGVAVSEDSGPVPYHELAQLRNYLEGRGVVFLPHCWEVSTE
ncbi:MAG: polysaccharide ABC transporter ATP-binding protein [Gemmatimonadota bacterium]